MLQGESAFYTIASRLVTALDAALVGSISGRPERACVVPGEIAWDECDCGMLAVSPRRWFLSSSFPEAAEDSGAARIGPCSHAWIVGELDVEIVRCAPSPTGTALSVPCAQLDAAAQQLVSDAYFVLNGTIELLCAMKEDNEIVDYVLADQETIGPTGGCVGVGLRVQVAVPR